MVCLELKEKKIDFRVLNDKKTPIDYLLVSVVLCLGHEILERKLSENRFREICITFGNEKIRISCVCEECDRILFKELVSGCFILKNLKFRKIVSFA